MRKKIQDLAYARFQYEKPVPEFGAERLEFEVLQGENYKGSFTIKSVNGISMRGIIYSSNSRMECLTPQFEGTEVTVPFEFHSEGLVEHDVQKGDFYVAIDGGEYNLSFVAGVTKYYPATTIGKVKNLFDFANLAQISMEEAYRIYRAPYFENIIKPSETRERMLYQALGKSRSCLQEMEEFLIGIHKKGSVTFQIEETKKNYSRLTEPVKEKIAVQKEHWGWLEIAVRSDADFLVPVHKQLTSNQFVGNRGQVEFLIETEKLHGGKNFGRIILESMYQTRVCEICVNQKRESGEGQPVLDKKPFKEAARLYMEYRMRRIVTGVWSKETCVQMDLLLEAQPRNPWYALMKAQALLINKQRQEAEWILDSFKREQKEEETPLYGFYLYLCTLRETETAYIQKKISEIREIYHKNQDNLILLLIMLFVDDELNNSKSRKLQAMEQQINRGNRSPLLYLEAYYLISRDVYLLKKAGSFEMQVLNWACKHKVLTKEVAKQVKTILPKVRTFHPVWYRILSGCYEACQEPEMLQAVCSYCIAWNRRGSGYFPWYDKGVKEELRIAGLYEAWLLSAKPDRMKQLPRVISMYFQYQSNLDYKTQALLYAGIIRSRDSQKNMVSDYQKNMEKFAVEQLLAGRIDENLAVIYEEVLEQGAVNGELAAALARVLYTHKLICKDEKAVRAVVVHSQLKDEQVVPFVNHHAYIQIYGGSYCILLEDARGMRYASGMDWQLRRLLAPGHYLKECMQYAGGQIPFLVHYFEGRKTWQTFRQEDMKRLLFLLDSEAVSESYRNEMKPQLVEYYYNSYTGEELDDYLNQVNYEGLERGSRNKLMELMIARGIYDRAYEMLLGFGGEQAAVSRLLAVSSQQIEKKSYEPDQSLTGLCHSIFKRGKYNETVLKYLCRHFQGTVRDMGEIWKAAREFDLDTYELEERFCVQLLYTEGYFEDMEQVFQSYYDAGGNEMVVLAYLSFFSYQYFVKEMVLSNQLFLCLEQQIFMGNELNDSCRLAYLKWLAEKKERTEKQERWLEKLVEEYLLRGMCFAFYQELPQRLLRKFHLYDKTFLEYRTHPKHRVVLSFGESKEEPEEALTEEELVSVYEGIFVKQFVVFFGEEIPYYIMEEGPDGIQATESGHIQCSDLCAQADESRYDIINGMMVSHCLKDEQTLQQLITKYEDLDQKAGERFTLL